MSIQARLSPRRSSSPVVTVISSVENRAAAVPSPMGVAILPSVLGAGPAVGLTANEAGAAMLTGADAELLEGPELDGSPGPGVPGCDTPPDAVWPPWSDEPPCPGCAPEAGSSAWSDAGALPASQSARRC